MKRALIACEYSGTVRDAFAARGWDTWSCDLLPTEEPGLHYQGDVAVLLDGWTPVRHQYECDPEGAGLCQITGGDASECSCYGPTQDETEYLEKDGILFARPEAHPHWDILIAFPPCTYLCSSGLHWTTRGLRDPRLTEDSLAFVRQLLNAPIACIALENPIGCISSRIRKPDQIVQPWQFGHDASKSTCLWLKNLPPLTPTDILPKPASGRWGESNRERSEQTRPIPRPLERTLADLSGVCRSDGRSMVSP